MSLKILIADPDRDSAITLGQYLMHNLYEIATVGSGKEVQAELYNKKYFAVILNMNIQNFAGAQVLTWIKTNQPSVKVILTFAKQEDIESMGINMKLLQKQGVNDIFFGEYRPEQILEVIEGGHDYSHVLSKRPLREGQSEEVEVSEEDQNFTSVKIDEFLSSQAVQFDVYIKLGNKKYIKILHAGDTFSRERLDKYKREKNVQNLYFLNSDRKKYIRFSNYLSEKIVENSQVHVEAKVSLLKNIGEKIVEEAHCEGVKTQIVEQSKDFCRHLNTLVNSNDQLAALMREFQEYDPLSHSHSFMVALYSHMIIKRFEWESRVMSENLGMAALFHDIGYIKLPQHISKTHPDSLSPADSELYKRHPILSLELIEGNPMVTTVTKQVVIQHHEHSDGTGFPNGLKGHTILNLAKILHIADDFCYFMGANQLSPVQAIKVMLSQGNCVKMYGQAIVENFIKIFIDVDKLAKIDSKKG